VLEPAGFAAVVSVAGESGVSANDHSVCGLVNQDARAGDWLQPRGHVGQLVDDFRVVPLKANLGQLSDLWEAFHG